MNEHAGICDTWNIFVLVNSTLVAFTSMLCIIAGKTVSVFWFSNACVYVCVCVCIQESVYALVLDNMHTFFPVEMVSCSQLLSNGDS